MAADVLAGIKLISKADTSGIEKMSAAVTDFQKTVVTTQMSVAPLLNVGKTFVGVGLAIEAGLGLAAAAAVNYEFLIQRIATSSRLAGEQIATLHDRFLELSATMGVSAEKLATLGFTASKLGLDAGGIEKFVKMGSQLELISRGAITAEEAISRIGRIGKVFGLDLAANADKIASTFVGLARVTTATESEIAAVVSRTAELGKSVGFTVPQLAALAATAKDLGLDGRRASGAIEDLLGAMTKKDSARFFAKQLHMTGYEFNQALGKNPVAILGKLQGAFKGLDPRILEDRLKHMGITSKATETLVKGLSDSHSALAKNLKIAQDEYEKGTAAAEAYEELIGTTKMQLEILWQTIKSVAIAFGEILLPPFKLIVMVANFFMRVILAIPKPIKVIMVIMAALVGAMFVLTGSVIIAVVALRRLNSALSGTIQGLLGGASAAGFRLSSMLQLLAIRATAVGGSFLGTGTILGTILGPLLAWGKGVVMASTGTFMFTGSLLAAGKAMLTMIGAALLPFIKIVAVVAAVALAVYIAWVALKPTLMEVWNAFKLLYEPIKVLVDGMKELVGGFGVTGGGLGETFITFVRIGMLPIIIHLKALAFGFRLLASVLTGVARGIIAVLRPIIEPLVKLWNFVKRLIAPVMEFFSALTSGGGAATGIFESIADAAEFAFKWLSPVGQAFMAVGAVFQAVGFIIENVWDGIMEAFAPLVDEIRQGIGAIGAMWNELVGQFVQAIDPIRQIMSEWVGGGEGVANILKGIGSVIKWLVSTALWPLITLFRVWNVLFTVFVAMIVAVGKILVFAFTPVFWLFKQIANAISLIVTAFKTLFGKAEEAAPAMADAVQAAADQVTGPAAAVGMVKPTSEHERRFRQVRGKDAHPIISSLKMPVPPEHHRGVMRPVGDRSPREETPHVPRVARSTDRIASAIGATTAAVTRTTAAVSGGSQPPAMNITIPVSVMMDGEELGQVIVKVSDDQIRRQFGQRAGRFSGVE